MCAHTASISDSAVMHYCSLRLSPSSRWLGMVCPESGVLGVCPGAHVEQPQVFFLPGCYVVVLLSWRWFRSGGLSRRCLLEMARGCVC